MVPRGWQCVKHAVSQRFARRLPALLDGVEFRCERGEVHETQRLLVLAAEFVDPLATMCWPIVDEEQDTPPSSERTPDKAEKLALPFSLRERIHEPPLGSRTEDVGGGVLVVDEDNGVASTSCPATRNDRNQTERCFVLRGYDESSSLVDAHHSPRFFLNAAMVAASAPR